MGGLSLDCRILVHVENLDFGVLNTSGEDQWFLAGISTKRPRIRQRLVPANSFCGLSPPSDDAFPLLCGQV
jgi:hypothetical protein